MIKKINLFKNNNQIDKYNYLRIFVGFEYGFGLYGPVSASLHVVSCELGSKNQ